MKRMLCVVGLVVSGLSFAVPRGELPLLRLPDRAALKLNGPFVVTSILSRSGTAIQSLIMTVDIDLKGDTREAVRSRHTYKAAINKLRELRNFASLERVFCYVDFNAKLDQDVLIAKGTSYRLAAPVHFGTPSERFTKTGRRVMIENYADKAVSASFADPLLRRLLCAFKADEAQRYNETYLDDLKISHLEVLLAPHFELQY